LKPKSSKTVDAHTQCSKQKRFKQTLSIRKLMETVFWDRKAALMVEFKQQGTTIHQKSNTKQICMAIQNKRYGMLTSSVVLLHDNAHPHTAACTQALLVHFIW
jgi:hypothetical protein